MSDDDFEIPLPAFKADDALVGLKRALRDVRGLQARGDGFDVRGQAVVTLAVVDGVAIDARLAQRPARSPEWTSRRLASSLDVRRFVDEVKKRAAGWHDDD